jgi:hypothetical protein
LQGREHRIKNRGNYPLTSSKLNSILHTS